MIKGGVGGACPSGKLFSLTFKMVHSEAFKGIVYKCMKKKVS
jgi:hypothetical protein